MKSYLAELVGTYGLVLVGTGAIILGLPHFWISACFGIIVTLMILCFGPTSGAHINPAVSIAFFLFNGEKKSLKYIPFQLAGGLLAALTLQVLFPSSSTRGETLPAAGIQETFVIEVFITFVLMLVILLIILTDRLLMVAFAIGFTVFLAAFFAGPYTGASMNPARSLGPAVMSNTASMLWLYFIAPILGASLSVPVFNFFRKIQTN